MSISIEDARQKYIDSPELELPYKTKSGGEFDEIKGFCPKCNNQLVDLKGTIREFTSCVELRIIGLCHSCKAIVECQTVRHYEDGHIVVYDDQLGWVESEVREHSSIIRPIIYGLAVAVVLGMIILFIF